jgi:hypothetical protein
MLLDAIRYLLRGILVVFDTPGQLNVFLDEGCRHRLPFRVFDLFLVLGVEKDSQMALRGFGRP